MLLLLQGGLTKVLAEGTNTKGYSSTHLAMGFGNIRAGTRVLILVLVQGRSGHACCRLG